MSNPSAQIVQKLWSYCNVLRDDGLSYGDYVEQLSAGALVHAAAQRMGQIAAAASGER